MKTHLSDPRRLSSLATLAAALLAPAGEGLARGPIPTPLNPPLVLAVDRVDRAPVPPIPAVDPTVPEPPEPVSIKDEIRRAQAEARRAAREVERQLAGMRIGFSGPEARRLAVIPSEATSDEALAESRDDLAVMATLLNRAAQPDRGRQGDLLLELKDWKLGGGRDLEALQIDGYGAVFFLGVDYPLVAPAAVEPPPNEPKNIQDNTWEKTRRELLGGGAPESDDSSPDPAMDDGSPATPFDPERVRQLEQRLKEALRHASNLRHLGGEDWIIVQVTGRSARPRPGAGGGFALLGGGAGGTAMISGKPPRGENSQMILRVRKSAAENLAAGRLKLEDFAREVKVSRRAEKPVQKPAPRDGSVRE